MSMVYADPRMASRPAKSAGVLWLRYTIQWLWFPLLMALWALPYVVVLVVYFVVLFPLAFVWGLDVPGPPGSGRRWRLRRRMWLNRKRLRRERSADTAGLEDQFRALFDGRTPVLEGRQSSGTTWRHRDGRVEVDDSYFRHMGAGRALQIAAEHGWTADQDGLRDLPVWLVLRRAADPTAHSAHGRDEVRG